MAQGSRGEISVTWNEKRNRYQARLSTDYDPDTGKQTRQLITGTSIKEVRAKITAAQQAQAEGRPTITEKRTVGAYLDRWATDVLPGTVTSSTLAQYQDVIRLYVVPYIGSKKVATLTPGDVSSMLQALAKAGKSPNTCRLARSVLRRALRNAEQDGTVVRNVAAIADGVKLAQPEGRTLTIDEARTLLAHISGDRLEGAFTLALTLGLRRGELLGLAWTDLDLDADRPSLTVTRSLKRIPRSGLELSDVKTHGSRRRVHLPAEVVETLRRHRVRQVQERLVLGAQWPEQPLGADLVFRSPLGTPVDPDNFRNRVYAVTAEAGLGRWSPHELRHSAASILIAMGVPLKIVSEMLGHSSIRITADVYGHLMEGAGIVAAEAMSGALFATEG